MSWFRLSKIELAFVCRVLNMSGIASILVFVLKTIDSFGNLVGNSSAVGFVSKAQ